MLKELYIKERTLEAFSEITLPAAQRLPVSVRTTTVAAVEGLIESTDVMVKELRATKATFDADL